MDPQTRYPFQLLDVRLYTATIKRLTPKSTTSETTERHIAPFLSINTKIQRQDQHNRISVFLNLEIKGLNSDDPEFHLEFTLEGIFETQSAFSDIEETLWKEFEELSAVTLLWPYAREYAQNFFQRMRINMPLLPTLNRLALQQMQDSSN